MTTNRPKTASRRPTAAMLTAAAALSLAAIPAFASAAPVAATFTGPTVHEQANLNVTTSIATSNVHTTVVKSPVLARGHYLVNLTMGINNIPPGAQVLYGISATKSGGIVTGNYGDVENEGTRPTTGNCVVTGTITINTTHDRVTGWATVFHGPGGATVGEFSENETPVGSVVITH